MLYILEFALVKWWLHHTVQLNIQILFGEEHYQMTEDICANLPTKRSSNTFTLSLCSLLLNHSTFGLLHRLWSVMMACAHHDVYIYIYITSI